MERSVCLLLQLFANAWMVFCQTHCRGPVPLLAGSRLLSQASVPCWERLWPAGKSTRRSSAQDSGAGATWFHVIQAGTLPLSNEAWSEIPICARFRAFRERAVRVCRQGRTELPCNQVFHLLARLAAPHRETSCARRADPGRGGRCNIRNNRGRDL